MDLTSQPIVLHGQWFSERDAMESIAMSSARLHGEGVIGR
jgi:hypothetical protein